MKSLTEQLSRERLEKLASGDAFTCIQDDEGTALARALLAVMDAKPAPVWGQARFKGGDWSSCSAEHAAMVMASPEEWGDYECRYLYTAPPAPSAPSGFKLVQVSDDEVLVALKRIECYEEVDAQILAEDALVGHEDWPEWRVVEVPAKPEDPSC